MRHHLASDADLAHHNLEHSTDPTTRGEEPRAIATKTILLVEDDEQVRIFMVEALEARGYEVLAAKNGRDALDLLRHDTTTVEALVTDVVMPEISGPELAVELARRNPALRVLYVSGYTGVSSLHCAWIGPETPFLRKPFEAKHLTRRVDELLSNA